MGKFSREELLAHLRTFHEQTGRIPTSKDKVGVNRTTYEKYFGSWNNAIKEAGFQPPRNKLVRSCLCCGAQVATTVKEDKKFCNSSCAAKANNAGRTVTDATKKKKSDAAKWYNGSSGRIWVRTHRNDPLKSNITTAKIGQKRQKAANHVSKTCVSCQTSFIPKNIGTKTCSKPCMIAHMKKVCGGYRSGAGHAKHGRYRGIWCDSSWEMAFLIYCLDRGKVIERNLDSWEYVSHKGITRRFYPDFRVDGVLHEIKGPQRPDDPLKIAAVDEPIVYIQGKVAMKPYLDYVTSTYGVARDNLNILYDTSRTHYKRICGGCDQEYTTTDIKSKCCSRKCAGTYSHRITDNSV